MLYAHAHKCILHRNSNYCSIRLYTNSAQGIVVVVVGTKIARSRDVGRIVNTTKLLNDEKKTGFKSVCVDHAYRPHPRLTMCFMHMRISDTCIHSVCQPDHLQRLREKTRTLRSCILQNFLLFNIKVILIHKFRFGPACH